MEIVAMLHCDHRQAPAASFAAPARCPHCGDWMVAPTVSEFVEGGEIRHHWVCEGCAETSVTSLALDASTLAPAE
jgi:hypothetical protein